MLFRSVSVSMSVSVSLSCALTAATAPLTPTLSLTLTDTDTVMITAVSVSVSVTVMRSHCCYCSSHSHFHCRIQTKCYTTYFTITDTGTLLCGRTTWSNLINVLSMSTAIISQLISYYSAYTIIDYTSNSGRYAEYYHRCHQYKAQIMYIPSLFRDDLDKKL